MACIKLQADDKMENYILNTFKGYGFEPDFKQVFANKQITTLVHEEILRMKNNGLITDDDLKVVKFIHEFKFATAEIIFHLLNKVDTVENIQNRLNRLVKNRILNQFMLSRLQSDAIHPDALLVYCLDIGGKTLLTHYSKCDLLNWNFTKNYWSSENIGYFLTTAYFYTRLVNTCGSKIVHFKTHPEYRIHKQAVSPSFEFALKINGVRKYFIGEVIREFDIPLAFRTKSEYLESILCTKAWMKYFHDEQETPPVLFLLCENEEVALEAAQIITTVSGIEQFRLTTDERMEKKLNEGGAFLKYNKENNVLQAIRTSTFDPE